MLTWDEFSKAVTLNGKTYLGVSTVTALRRAVSKRREKSRLTQNAPPYSALPWTELAATAWVDGPDGIDQPPDPGGSAGCSWRAPRPAPYTAARGVKNQAFEQSAKASWCARTKALRSSPLHQQTCLVAGRS